ncbi:MAG TPA: GNAT family N-acetyltransferase [Pyrinomonadaceae bacterium]|nr:GNAT family N-acetyltransferase [Pyrinomonadaceae bacterium]
MAIQATRVPSSSNKTSVTGYAHAGYAASLLEFGTPRLLPGCDGWILERAIEGSRDRDAMGCYPLFACQDWSQLPDDLENLSEDCVSLVLVTDPFGDYSEESLQRTFKDLVIPFKEHFIVDLARTSETFIHTNHRRNARKTLATISVATCDVSESIDEWISLYANLVARHDIRGIARFSNSAFAAQAKVPGAVMLRAIHEGRTVGMTWWFVREGVGYYHLGAYSDAGYDLGASFGIFSRAIELFRADGLRWLDLGAGAGLANDAQDGLSRFKRGWSTGTRTAYLCGRILNRRRYAEIVRAKDVAATNYFPAYRTGEFG